MKIATCTVLLILKMGVPCLSQKLNNKSIWGFGAGVGISRLVVNDTQVESFYNTALNIHALMYEYKIISRVRVGVTLNMQFSNYLLKKGVEREAIKYALVSSPMKISYYPIRYFPMGISSALGLTYLIEKQKNAFSPYNFKKIYGLYEGEIFFNCRVKNIILRPFLNYGCSITKLVSEVSGQQMGVNYNAFSSGIIIY